VFDQTGLIVKIAMTTLKGIIEKCQNCNKPFNITNTSYGVRKDCYECDLTGWGKHAPTNSSIRNARNKAHESFDRLWKNNGVCVTLLKSRVDKVVTDDNTKNIIEFAIITPIPGYAMDLAYNWLAFKLGVPHREAHMGSMDIEQCNKVISICSTNVNADEIVCVGKDLIESFDIIVNTLTIKKDDDNYHLSWNTKYGKTSSKIPITAMVNTSFATINNVKLLISADRIYVKGDAYPIKDILKSHGAWWDAEMKQWYFPAENPDINHLLKDAPEYVCCPFAKIINAETKTVDCIVACKKSITKK